MSDTRRAPEPAERARRFRVCIERLRDAAADANEVDDALFEELARCWGNAPWTARPAFLSAVARAAGDGRGALLECGCGLTTLVIAAVVARRPRPVLSLEHQPEWAARVRLACRGVGLACPPIAVSALVDHGGFHWYATPPLPPTSIDLVVCDGPPRHVPGGRRGLLPVMAPVLGEQCRILLDDRASADGEAAVRAWCDDHGFVETALGGNGSYCVLRRASRSVAT